MFSKVAVLADGAVGTVGMDGFAYVAAMEDEPMVEGMDEVRWYVTYEFAFDAEWGSAA